MSEFDALAIGGEHDGVVADDVTTAEGVHADFLAGAGADVADAAVGDVVFVRGAGFLVEDIEEAPGGAGGGIDFVAVVHLGDFNVEALVAEDGGGFPREPEEGVDADGEVGGVDDGDGLRGFVDGGEFPGAVAGGADDELGAGGEGGFDHFLGEGMEGEVDDCVGVCESSSEVFADVMGGSEFGVWIFGDRFLDGEAHAAGGTGNRDFHRIRF